MTDNVPSVIVPKVPVPVVVKLPEPKSTLSLAVVGDMVVTERLQMAPPVIVSTYVFTAFCVGYNVSDTPKLVSVDLLATFSGVNPKASSLSLKVFQSVEDKYPSAILVAWAI